MIRPVSSKAERLSYKQRVGISEFSLGTGRWCGGLHRPLIRAGSRFDSVSSYQLNMGLIAEVAVLFCKQNVEGSIPSGSTVSVAQRQSAWLCPRRLWGQHPPDTPTPYRS